VIALVAAFAVLAGLAVVIILVWAFW